MLKVQEIRELIRLVDQSSLEEFKYEYDGMKLEMKKRKILPETAMEAPVRQPAAERTQEQPGNAEAEAGRSLAVKVENEGKPAVAEPSPAKEEGGQNAGENLHKITSPMVGTFYQAPSPGAEPYVKIGSKVKKNTVVCIIEAMKLFNEIEADVEGEIVDILVKDGQLVEYGQPLFLVKEE
nr:acetyl-CoA carboxylase biotin carboxyl carrier protein [Caldibacillus debilis]